MGATASMGWDGRAGERPLLCDASRLAVLENATRATGAQHRTNARGNSIRAFLASPLRIWIPREEDTFPASASPSIRDAGECVFSSSICCISIK